MDYKDILNEMFEDFVEEHGREPTLEESDGFWSSYCCGVIESHKED